jgi:hypothetical protein
MTAVWTFLNSPLGITLIVGLVGKLFASAVKEKTRRQKILEYARQAFQLAEMIGLRQGLKGNAKYLVFVEELVKGLAARGEAPLSAEEKRLVDQLAYEQAWLVPKPVTPAPTSRLPLPPPPHG